MQMAQDQQSFRMAQHGHGSGGPSGIMFHILHMRTIAYKFTQHKLAPPTSRAKHLRERFAEWDFLRMETEFTPVASVIGGLMIGAASIWLFLATGRIAGISGLVSRILPPVGNGVTVSVAFVAGLLLAAPLFALATGGLPQQTVSSNIGLLVVAGLLVGFGSVFGSGCTSGHGVCGLGRLSPRSLVATLTFMATAFATVLVLRHGSGYFGLGA
ncbi:MAG: YeeE/YedE family protein [Pseudomonadota bacterium]